MEYEEVEAALELIIIYSKVDGRVTARPLDSGYDRNDDDRKMGRVSQTHALYLLDRRPLAGEDLWVWSAKGNAAARTCRDLLLGAGRVQWFV